MSIKIKNIANKYNRLKKAYTGGVMSDNGSGLTRITINNEFSSGETINVFGSLTQDGNYKTLEVTSTYVDIDSPFFANQTDISVDNAIYGCSGLNVIGKKPSELGLINRSTQIVKKSFYDRNKIFDNLYFLQNSVANGLLGMRGSIPDFIRFDRSFTFVLEGYQYTGGGGVSVFFVKNGINNGVLSIRVIEAGNFFLSGFGVVHQFSAPNLNLDGKDQIIFAYNHLTPSLSYLKINGVADEVGNNDLDSLPSLDPTDMDGGSIYATTRNNTSPRAGCKQIILYDRFIEPDVEPDENYADFVSFENFPNRTITSKLLKTNYVSNYVDNRVGSANFLEEKTDLPPINQFADLTGLSISGNHVPIDENFSIVLRFKLGAELPTALNSFLQLKEGVTTRLNLRIGSNSENPEFRFGNTSRFDFFYKGDSNGTFGNNPFNTSNTNTFVINYKREATNQYSFNIFINGFEFTSDNTTSTETLTLNAVDTIELNTSLFEFEPELIAILPQNITQREAVEIGNSNMLNKELITRAWTLLQFQEGSATEDGTDVILKNWGSGDDLIINNLTGATSADRLSDWENNRVINI